MRRGTKKQRGARERAGVALNNARERGRQITIRCANEASARAKIRRIHRPRCRRRYAAGARRTAEMRKALPKR